jgi:hypothetical protein
MVEVQMLLPTVLRSIAERLGPATIERVRFEVGDVPERPAGPRSATRASPRWPRRPEEPLPAAIEGALGQVDDPDLRRAMRRAVVRARDE